MAVSETPQPNASEQVAELNRKLSVMRHNVNNHLALVVAATELLRRKPELAPRLLDNILAQPERINSEIRSFSEAFETAFGAKRHHPLCERSGTA
jgi:hypothetical protein